MLDYIKDKAKKAGLSILKSGLNSYLETDVLKVSDIEINDGIIEIELKAKGENEPIFLTINDYDLKIEDSKFIIENVEITSSKEWVSYLLKLGKLQEQKFEFEKSNQIINKFIEMLKKDK